MKVWVLWDGGVCATLIRYLQPIGRHCALSLNDQPRGLHMTANDSFGVLLICETVHVAMWVYACTCRSLFKITAQQVVAFQPDEHYPLYSTNDLHPLMTLNRENSATYLCSFPIASEL
jgi:hypothetical protein